jgi:hypothetical protein
MTGAHSLISTTNYSYSQGLYDFPTKEFSGFGTVSETRADDSKVIHYYYQDEAKKGKEYKTETKNNSDALFASVQNTFSEALSNGVYISNIALTDEYTYNEYWPSCSSVYVVDRLKHKYIQHRFSQNPKRHNYFGLQLRKNQ